MADKLLDRSRPILSVNSPLTEFKDMYKFFCTVWTLDWPAQAYYFRLLAAEFLPQLVEYISSWYVLLHQLLC